MYILVYFISVYIVCSVCPSAIWQINVFINAVLLLDHGLSWYIGLA